VFVDGNLVGGDEDAVLLIPEPPLWEKIRSGGRLRYLWARNWRTGLIAWIALGAALLVRGVGTVASVLLALVLTVAVVPMHSDGIWRNAERQYLYRQRKLGDPTWRAILDLSPLRRGASLFCFAAGALGVSLSALAGALGVAAGSAVLLFVAVVGITVGTVLIVYGVQLRREPSSDEDEP
jgi:hypothetical protein